MKSTVHISSDNSPPRQSANLIAAFPINRPSSMVVHSESSLFSTDTLVNLIRSGIIQFNMRHDGEIYYSIVTQGKGQHSMKSWKFDQTTENQLISFFDVKIGVAAQVHLTHYFSQRPPSILGGLMFGVQKKIISKDDIFSDTKFRVSKGELARLMRTGNAKSHFLKCYPALSEVSVSLEPSKHHASFQLVIDANTKKGYIYEDPAGRIPWNKLVIVKRAAITIK